MDLKKQLLQEHSRDNALRIARYVLQQKEQFSILWRLVFDENKMICQRAAWPLTYIAAQKPGWFLSCFDEILKGIQAPAHDAVSRNLYRILQDLPVPESSEGLLFSLCINDLEDPAKPVAIKAFAMTVAFNISRKYPELQQELAAVIEANAPSQTPAYFSRARKILAEIAN